ncbi:hypothetical protein OIDMADRAFT_150101 [Oidiodendron maius Zn]|uniref:Uncharacterized protein n=1 Tax=Oidiodendron maius (strain Zn) TaxID=913774 RepID=A0A0C3HUY1_OIDMZ|nr:hypothetical protein OIDMADRAFT_150101 [Oidiodendron maius Zn]
MAEPHPTPASSRVWLVTGCSSGLGRHLVFAILARGDKVIATARKISDLDYINNIDGGKERALGITLNVTEPYDHLRDRIDKAIGHFGSIDVLVNNAGFVVSGVWEELSQEETSRQFETNFFGALKVTRSILPYFRDARSGVILFMGSISGWHGVGAGGPYSCSKFALEGAAECLAKETAHLGIRTHILVLGQFRTRILDERSTRGFLSPTGISDYDSIKAEMADRHKETHGKQPGNPELAAQKVLDIVRLENLTKEEKDNLPLRIPLGTDALEIMRLKCTQTIESLRIWDAFARSTDFVNAATIPSYYR